MEKLIPGIIMSFREGFEAFLLIILIMKYLDKTNNKSFRKPMLIAFFSSIVMSMLLGYIFNNIGTELKRVDEIGKLWESFASIAAVGLVTAFILWMIQHGSTLQKHVEEKASKHLTSFGIFGITFIMITREGVEIVIFSFAGQYDYIAILIGISLALLLAVLMYFALIKIKLSLIFQITILYLILQAGYLIGYGVHELLSALKSLSFIAENSVLLLKLYDVSTTAFNNKEGFIGMPLNIVFGWYAKPEIIQFIIQYLYTSALLIVWLKQVNRYRETK